MPGLVGIVSLTGEKVNPHLMMAMRDVIRHFDWYQVDDYINADNTVAIARIHLNIINREKQPYLGRSDKVKIFFHGELFNDEALKSDPREFIYYLYEKEGTDSLSSLNGSFLIVIIDEDRDIVMLANDRIASKPLFIFNDGRAIYFSPEMKSLFLVPSLRRTLNQSAVADFLSNGYYTREHTLIEGLETLDSATIIEIMNGKERRYKYWEYNLETGGKDRGTEYYKNTLAQLLRTVVKRRLQSCNNNALLLSGGVDSRGILGGYIKERGNEGLNTISWGREEDIPGSDCAVAKRLAKKVGANHRFYKLEAKDVFMDFHKFIMLGEGLTRYPESYDVFHRIREEQQINILFRGDTCFGRQTLMVYDESTMFRVFSLYAMQHIRYYQKVLKRSSYKDFCELNTETMRFHSSRCKEKNIHNRKDFFHLNMNNTRFLNPLNYVKNFAVETLRPLLDYDILDFVCSLPLRYRLSKYLYKKTVVELFPEVEEEFAQVRNDIDWAASFRNSPEMQRFIYRELVESQNIISEFMDINNLKKEIDTFFSVPLKPSGLKARTKAGLHRLQKRAALKLRETSPSVFDFTYKQLYLVQKRMGKIKVHISFDQILLRLLILKVWADVFLGFPVVRTSNDLSRISDYRI